MIYGIIFYVQANKIRFWYIRLVVSVGSINALDFSRIGLGEWDLLYIMGLSFLRFRGDSPVLSTFSVLQFSLFSSPLVSFGLASVSSSIPSVLLPNTPFSKSFCVITVVVVVIAAAVTAAGDAYVVSPCINSANSSSSFTCEHEEEHRASRMCAKIKIQRLHLTDN